MPLKTNWMPILLTAVMSVATCQASSIWARRTSTSKALYADDKANQIGDLLTIIISEDHKVDNKVKRDASRNTSRQLAVGAKDISVEHVLPTVPEVNIDLKSGKSLQGKSDYKDERSIEDSITVVVVDIHPNGNLVVIGTRSRDINADIQTIQVSGIVRPSDIAFGNIVHSERVANFQLVTLSEGVTDDFNKPGWLGRVLDKIWPF
ncbi:MAG: flagellar basal body L-ring protein FlgH [Phycisphaerae bacterium]|nr:flagellar basal body L-ring protein FlgH [Phycisphaerae bacterium]